MYEGGGEEDHRLGVPVNYSHPGVQSSSSEHLGGDVIPSLSCVSCRLLSPKSCFLTLAGFPRSSHFAVSRRQRQRHGHRIVCSEAMSWMKMDECFRVALSDKQISVVQHWGPVNGGRTDVSGPRFVVFLFKNYKHKDVMEFIVLLFLYVFK